jgi:hypothetical protein
MFWIYKCNTKEHPYQVAVGDWDDFFRFKRPQRWGSTEWIPGLIKAQPGDVIIAYQTNRNELVGLARVLRHKRRGQYLDLILKPIRTIRVKVRPLKLANRSVGAIPALHPGPIRTLYKISTPDARSLLAAAGIRAPSDKGPSDSGIPIGGGGGGFGDTKENKRVEAAAMRFVLRDYRSRGWNVTDVSAQFLGYDLLCTKRRHVAHVEVKGSSGSDLHFILTENERRTWAIDPAYILVLVTNARTRPKLYPFPGVQAMRRFRLKPVSYSATANKVPA